MSNNGARFEDVTCCAKLSNFIKYCVYSQSLTTVGVLGDHNDPHWLVWDVSSQNFDVAPCVFICTYHSPSDPVGPKDQVPINCQSKKGPRP